MIKAIGWIIKVSVFAALVLVAANWVRVGGKTVSDQVKTQMSHAERSELVGTVKDWATTVTKDAQRSFEKRANLHNTARPPNPMLRSSEDGNAGDRSSEFPSSERQKLQALIRELNASRGRD
jgi:hypothetical protein